MNEILKYSPDDSFELKGKKEKNKESEAEKINITFIGDIPANKAFKKVLSLLSNNVFNIIGETEDILKNFEKEKTDIIFLNKSIQSEEGVLKFIAKVRNSPNIKKQPAIIVVGSFSDNVDNMQKIVNLGADIGLLQPLSLAEIFKNISSIPKILSKIEDEYGEKMFVNKQYFYKEYKGKLAERSDFTADTEKELEILEEIFEENGVKKVLDAGGGEGRIAVPLSQKNYEVVNIDASEELISKMNENQKEIGNAKKVFGVVGDLKNMPIESESQETVTFNWHIFCDILGKKSKKKTLEEAYRVLKIGGVIVLDIPDRVGGSYEKDGVYIQNPGGENIFIGYTPSEKEMKDYLKEANFRNIEVRKWETKRGFKKITFIAKKLV